MTDQTNPAASSANSRTFVINAQYVKDLSFENPDAPRSLFALKEKPQIDLSVDIKAGKVQEDTYEVALEIACKAIAEGKPVFLTELSYAGIFTLENEGQKDAERTLLIDCANVLYPFVRRIIADTTRDGGFPPLMLDPIDFRTLYEQRKQAA